MHCMHAHRRECRRGVRRNRTQARQAESGSAAAVQRVRSDGCGSRCGDGSGIHSTARLVERWSSERVCGLRGCSALHSSVVCTRVSGEGESVDVAAAAPEKHEHQRRRRLRSALASAHSLCARPAIRERHSSVRQRQAACFQLFSSRVHVSGADT